MTKRRQPWERVYDRIRVVRNPRFVALPPITDTELDAVEAQLGSRLPFSYREFMRRFGPGELLSWARLNPINPPKKRPDSTVVGRTKAVRKYHLNNKPWKRNEEWLASLVYFANSCGGDEYAWDPAAVTRAPTNEYRFYYLPRMAEDRPVAVGDTLWQFVEWLKENSHTWTDSEEVEEDGQWIKFWPARLRSKKYPLKRDVKLWLACNDGTVRELAQSIREGNKGAFPILADALEDAGCTHADLLQSCRGGDPETDGVWALQVLLGKD